MIGEVFYVIFVVFLFLNECGGIVGRNLFLCVNESNGEKLDIFFFLLDVVEYLCLNDCIFKGKCVNGFCICNKGFIFNDCVILIE